MAASREEGKDEFAQELSTDEDIPSPSLALEPAQEHDKDSAPLNVKEGTVFMVEEARIVNEKSKAAKPVSRINRWLIAAVVLVLAVIILVVLLVLFVGRDSTSSASSTATTLAPSVISAPTSLPTTFAPAQLLPMTSAPSLTPTSAATAASPTAVFTPTVIPTPQSTIEVLALIQSVALQGGAEFDHPNSYQFRARAWVGANPINTGNRTVDDSRNIQRYALASIYYNTNSVQTPYTDTAFGLSSPIPEWNRADSWLDPSVDECNWYGITCDNGVLVSRIELVRMKFF
jgi:hypothetical protein